jgi:hypothetical protein
LAALFLGQAALRLAGASEWSWLAPAVGLSVAMLVAAPAIHVPGRCATVAILLGVLTIAAAVWCLRSPQHRPPLSGLLAAAPVAFLVLVPFLAVGRGGILGVTVNNDMAAHLLFAEGILSSVAREASPLPLDYPLGPHTLAATLSEGLGIELDLAFSGWTMAIPVINAWTVLAVARRASWFGKAVLATVAGMPFLVAAYYGQGAFKEFVLAGLVLAVVLGLSGCGPRLGRGRWVPFALLLGGIISVYSLAGLPWPLVIAGLWLAGLLAIQAWDGALREVPRAVRRELPALGIGLAVLVVSLIPQAHRIWQFLTLRHGTGIPVDDLGNLVAPLPGWEAFGVWNSPDFRLPASPAFTAGMWTAFVLGLVLFGTYWAFRRGRWLLPLAAAGALVIWRVSEHSQSPYVSAKALVIASPLLLVLAVLPLVDRGSDRRPFWPWLLVSLLGLALFLRVGVDDLRALRWSPVGPTDHARQLETFRPLVRGKPTLFLGNDEFINWELSGSPVQWTAVAATPELPLRPRKAWEYGQAIDIDSLSAGTLNDYEWIVGPRDAASSAPPPQLRLVRSTEDYRLWRRIGRIRERSILREGEWPGAVLHCDTEEGRAILAAGGVAGVRRPPIVAPVTSAAAGATVSARLNLPVGEWELETPYTSPLPVEVTAPGLRATLSANLDRPGPRLPIGRITIRRRQPLSISFHVEDTALAPATAIATFNHVVATPAGSTDRVVPIDRACGKYVDWYRGR